MKEPLRLGIAGLGTVGASVVAAARAPRRRASRRSSAGRCGWPASARATARATAASPSTAIAWHDDPVGLARSNSIDVFVELIGGADGAGACERRAPRSTPAKAS